MSLPPSAVNLADPSTYAVGPPHAFFDWLRAEAPVWWHESDEYPPGFWVCTKYRDVIDIERNTAVFSSARGGALLVEQVEADQRHADGERPRLRDRRHGEPVSTPADRRKRNRCAQHGKGAAGRHVRAPQRHCLRPVRSSGDVGDERDVRRERDERGGLRRMGA